MTPLSLLSAQKFASRLTGGNALQQQITELASAANVTVPTMADSQVILSSAPTDTGDKNLQLTYPRVCVFCSGIRNTQAEKFRTFSGDIALVAEVWASADFATQTDQWIHFYVEGITAILRESIGDWGSGIFFPGLYDIQFQPAKAGGLGTIQSAKLTFSLQVSLV